MSTPQKKPEFKTLTEEQKAEAAVPYDLKHIRPGFFASSNSCDTCMFRGQNAGTHHANCSKKTAMLDVNPHGIENGWATWPLDFDPIWIDSCDSYVNKSEEIITDGFKIQLLTTRLLHYYQSKLAAISKHFNDYKAGKVHSNVLELERYLLVFKKIDNGLNELYAEYDDSGMEDYIKVGRVLTEKEIVELNGFCRKLSMI